MLIPKTYNPADWDKAVVEACDHYNRSGEIQNILLTGFDQKGRWIGLKKRTNGLSFPRSLTAKLSREKIPVTRCVTTNSAGESVLFSSFHSSSNSLVLLPFHHVAGWIRAKNATAFSAPQLRSVGWDMELRSSTRLVIPSLVKVGGKIRACSVVSFVADRLQSVGGGLNTIGASKLHAPLLRLVGGALQAESATHLDLSGLWGVMEEMNCDSAEELYLPELRQVDGTLLANRARTLVAPELCSVDFLFANSATSVQVPKLVCHATYISVTQAREFIEIDDMGGKTLHASIYDNLAESVFIDFVCVKGHIEVSAKSFHAPNLESVGGDLLADSAREVVAPRLRRVGGKLDTSSAREFWKTDLHCGAWTQHPDAKKVRLAREARSALHEDPDLLI